MKRAPSRMAGWRSCHLPVKHSCHFLWVCAGTRNDGAGTRNNAAVSRNETAVSGNETAVSRNKTAVSGNETAVSGNKTAVSGNKTAVSGNKTAVSGNKTAVSGNKTAVSGNETSRETPSSNGQERAAFLIGITRSVMPPMPSIAGIKVCSHRQDAASSAWFLQKPGKRGEKVKKEDSGCLLPDFSYEFLRIYVNSGNYLEAAWTLLTKFPGTSNTEFQAVRRRGRLPAAGFWGQP